MTAGLRWRVHRLDLPGGGIGRAAVQSHHGLLGHSWSPCKQWRVTESDLDQSKGPRAHLNLEFPDMVSEDCRTIWLRLDAGRQPLRGYAVSRGCSQEWCCHPVYDRLLTVVDFISLPVGQRRPSGSLSKRYVGPAIITNADTRRGHCGFSARLLLISIGPTSRRPKPIIERLCLWRMNLVCGRSWPIAMMG